MCGEKMLALKLSCWSGGSPPRVRGKARFAVLEERMKGITPACAGKSGYPVISWGSNKDHPRVCGEKMPCILL